MFCKIVKYVVSSRLVVRKVFILSENIRFRSSQPRKAPTVTGNATIRFHKKHFTKNKPVIAPVPAPSA